MIYPYEIKELIGVDYNPKYFTFMRMFPHMFQFVWNYKEQYKKALEENFFTAICFDYEWEKWNRLVLPFKYISEFQKFLLSWKIEDLPKDFVWEVLTWEENWPIWYRKIWEDFDFNVYKK